MKDNIEKLAEVFHNAYAAHWNAQPGHECLPFDELKPDGKASFVAGVRAVLIALKAESEEE